MPSFPPLLPFLTLLSPSLYQPAYEQPSQPHKKWGRLPPLSPFLYMAPPLLPLFSFYPLLNLVLLLSFSHSSFFLSLSTSPSPNSPQPIPSGCQAAQRSCCHGDGAPVCALSLRHPRSRKQHRVYVREENGGGGEERKTVLRIDMREREEEKETGKGEREKSAPI